MDLLMLKPGGLIIELNQYMDLYFQIPFYEVYNKFDVIKITNLIARTVLARCF